MASLSRENRRLLENTIVAVRRIAVEAATSVLRDQLAVSEAASWPHLTPEQKDLRNRLRAHGRQLGDSRDARTGKQDIGRLAQACAYELWHRMLFARFLAENDLLLDPDHGVAMTLDEIRQMAQEQNRDWLDLAADLALRMLIAVFQPEDPILLLTLPPETRLQLEEKLASLPTEVFLADDSLGWVYQFWQSEEKDRVNKSEVKIGADELPAVTQLFTEDYMVLFLLENTLGAWWTAKRKAEGKDPALPGYSWTYLRLNDDGSPTAGGFDGWPRMANELRVLDPCMGSGHFLVFALPILSRMRMEEEGLTLRQALFVTLRDNIFGLEIDARCSQIAAFNLAMAAWRLDGEHFSLPELQLACSGIGPNCTKEQWVKLAEEVAASGGMPTKSSLFESDDSLLSEPIKRTMESLHGLFSQAPVLGSLIDPSRLRANLFQTDYRTVAPLLLAVLKEESATEETREQVIAAAGMAKAASLLSGKYSLVVTNVPFLGRGKQSQMLVEFCEEHHFEAKNDLATCFVDRAMRFCSLAGTAAIVSPQNWIHQVTYTDFIEKLTSFERVDLLVHLGTKSFQTPMWDFNVMLFIISHCEAPGGHRIIDWDVAQELNTQDKARALRCLPNSAVDQIKAFRPNGEIGLNRVARCYQGISTGDNSRWLCEGWEVSDFSQWRPFLTPSSQTVFFSGRTSFIRSEVLSCDFTGGAIRGGNAWGKKGVAVARMGQFRATLYSGELFSNVLPVIIPNEQSDLPAIWSFVESDQFEPAIRAVTGALNVDNGYIEKIPFDLSIWTEAARKRYPHGLPAPQSTDPTQWLFNGHPEGSDFPLQVAVARLLGYRWPRQTGSSFPDCPALGPDGLEAFVAEDGIVPLSSVAGISSAADRLRALLAAAYGAAWSASKLAELLGNSDSLEIWLRDRFFEEHCQLYKQRPFGWHVWDGRKDGFHALVNYHKLAAAHGEGRKTLEKLIYTTLGDWIRNQRADVAAGADGADGRLAAALHLKGELEKVLVGENPCDLFVRWKPLDQQPVGWEPDINDGVRLNIRPWLATTLAPGIKPKKDACVLRIKPKIKYGNDRGREPERKKEEFPWFWTWDETTEDFTGGSKFDGSRWNDLHYSIKAKQDARTRKQQDELLAAAAKVKK
jgi:hypothetical protein